MATQMLAGKTAVITGGSRGLGYSIAEIYARAGAAVVIAARSATTLEHSVAELKAQGLRAAGQPCDVGDLAQVEALAQFALDSFGPIDVWVNNAGVAGVYGPTAHMPVERFERVIRTNINGTYYGSVVALRHMVPRGTGKLINLLGRGDSGPVPNQNAYGASKYWVKSFTLALAREYKGSGVGIYAFNPGLVDTDLLHQLDVIEGWEQKVSPLRAVMRLWANPPEVPAQRALWLVSPATDGKTGLNVNVLNRRALVGGLFREAGRRLRRAPGIDNSLDITSIPSQL